MAGELAPRELGAARAWALARQLAQSPLFLLGLALALLRRLVAGARLRGPLLRFGSHGRNACRPPVGSIIGTVSRLNVFPAKSMRGVPVEHARVDRNGLFWDRQIMVINRNKVPTTQRMLPELARVEVTALAPDGSALTLRAPGAVPPMRLDLAAARARGPLETIDLHGMRAKCAPLGEEADGWINAVLSELGDRPRAGYRLMCIAAGESRRVDASVTRALFRDTKPFDGTALADLAPIALTSEASLAALNRQAREAVPLDRFRSNIEMDTELDLAFLEDHIQELQIGDLSLRVLGPTFRCVIPSVDQATGRAGFRSSKVSSAEPLATLKRLRPGGLRFGLTGLLPVGMGGSRSLAPLFGVYMGVSDAAVAGAIQVGDPIRVISYRDRRGPFGNMLAFVADRLGVQHAT
mmetsp:Transcript_14053/g.45020  ORF Transcript_14053/g.45020 Transcript_14053/m.45020 type:complete len:409 (+) Transcript_14053:44-1270(+)